LRVLVLGEELESSGTSAILPSSSSTSFIGASKSGAIQISPRSKPSGLLWGFFRDLEEFFIVKGN
jgi:hypothetical protein